MPTYSYLCTQCGHAFDAQQSFTDDALTTCPECSGRLRKVFGNVGVVFKGSGFYRNDARKEAKGSSSSRNGGTKKNGTSSGSDGGSEKAASSSGASGTSGSGNGLSGNGSSTSGSTSTTTSSTTPVATKS